MRIYRALFMFLAAVPVWAQGNSDNVRALNARILQLHGAIQSATASQKGQIQAQAVSGFAPRSAALPSLVPGKTPPAPRPAVSHELRAGLAEGIPSAAAATGR